MEGLVTCTRGGSCEDRVGTGSPWARTEVMYVDLGYLAISGLIHPQEDPVRGESIHQCSELVTCTRGVAGDEQAGQGAEHCWEVPKSLNP